MIISRTPYRISFFGGGTDYPEWCRAHGGTVPATTINKYCYITCRYLPPFFNHRFRVDEHPETIVALAFFDMDLYKPTRECLQIIKDHLTKGSILAFDELNDPEAPGETVALKEVFGLGRYSIQRYPFASRVSYIVIA